MTGRFASLCVARARARDVEHDSSDANARVGSTARESARSARMMGTEARGTLRRGTPRRAGRERDDESSRMNCVHERVYEIRKLMPKIERLHATVVIECLAVASDA